MKLYLYLLFFAVADTAVWFGIYFLSAKAHIRRAEKENFPPELPTLRICLVILWIVVHGFLLWTGVEIVKWGGMN